METLERLIKVFHAVFEDSVDTSALTPESSLKEDVGINSIGLLYMAMAVEEEFGIKFSSADFASIITVADVIACIEEKCKK